MKQLRAGILSLAACLFLGQAGASAAPKVIDNTNTTFGWQLVNDKPPAPTLEVVAGPKAKDKAIQLQYKFDDGIWIAIVKNVSVSIAEGEGVRFNYQGKGAVVNVKIKISDAAGTVFGYTVPYGSVTGEWKEVIIPRSAFTYLWGGSGANSMNWSSISKFEFTLDLDSMSGVSYTVDKSRPGEIAFYNIQVVSAKGVAVKAVGGASAPVSTGAAPKVQVGKDGSYLIHPMDSAAGWSSMSDQDGKVEMSSKMEVTSNKKAVKTLKVDYDFGSKGIWNALILNTSLNLSDMKFMRFNYRGEGGAHKLILKLTDAAGAVFGYTVGHATNTASWTNVLVPKADFKYLYGGSGPNLDWGRVVKVEFTIDKGGEEKSNGTLLFQKLQYK